MNAELLLAIAALCQEPSETGKYCKTMLIECTNQSETKDADAAAQCYWDSVMRGPWCPDPNDPKYKLTPEELSKFPKKADK